LSLLHEIQMLSLFVNVGIIVQIYEKLNGLFCLK